MLDDYVKEIEQVNGDASKIKAILVHAVLDSEYDSKIRDEVDKYMCEEYKL